MAMQHSECEHCEHQVSKYEENVYGRGFRPSFSLNNEAAVQNKSWSHLRNLLDSLDVGNIVTLGSEYYVIEYRRMF